MTDQQWGQILIVLNKIAAELARIAERLEPGTATAQKK